LLRAGLVSLTETIAALAQLLASTEADSLRLDQPSIRFRRAAVLFRQAALQAEAVSGAEAFRREDKRDNAPTHRFVTLIAQPGGRFDHRPTGRSFLATVN
jgi:hypothetical protein